MKQNNALLDALKEAMQLGVDLNDEEQRNAVFDKVTFRVKYLDENSERLHGTCILKPCKYQRMEETGARSVVRRSLQYSRIL